MVIEYKIKFEDGGVTVTQSVTRTPDDGGGSGPQKNPAPGGSGPQKDPGPHGGGPSPDPGTAGHAGGGANGVLAVILGPLVIGTAGPSASGAVAAQNVPVVTNLKERPKAGHK